MHRPQAVRIEPSVGIFNYALDGRAGIVLFPVRLDERFVAVLLEHHEFSISVYSFA
jgi:hypothetical protein